MRRILQVLAAACLLATLAVAPASGQEADLPSPLDVLLDAFEPPEGQQFTARFIKDPTAGVASLEDPIGDFVHSTGQEPGFTPDHIDITSTWALELDPGPIDLFTPTDENNVWAPRGKREIDPPNFEAFATFTGEQIHDGSQYQSGAYLFGFTLVETPPFEPPGRCEYVIWINDLERGDTFVNNPSFPLDPAGGTNLAVGLALNPVDGPGTQAGFAVELQETGGFAPVFEADIRAFVTPGYVGVTMPRELVGDLAAANFYTFCVEEGITFEPGESGADQTGLIEMTAEDFGVVQFEATDAPTESTTTTTQPTTTTTEPPPDTTTSMPPADDGVLDDDEKEGLPWLLVLAGSGIGLAIVGWWLYRSYDPCRKPLETWESARRDWEAAQNAAEETAEACDTAELELERLESERDELCRAWPPACWDTDEGDWIEDEHGNRITSRDIHMRKVALGDVWADYRAGKISASQVEEQWRQLDTPAFREELRQTGESFKDLLDQIEADLADARRELDEACGRAAEAQKAADEKGRDTSRAKAAYEKCAGKASAARDETDTEGEDGQVADASAFTATTSGQVLDDPCQGRDGERELRRAGEADRTRVFVDFSVITGVEDGSEREIAAGERLVLELADLATEFGFAGDLLDARSAGLHIGGAINGYAAGKYTVTASGVLEGGADGAMATADIIPDVPTTPVQVDVEGLEFLARLGGVIAGEVAEWMANIQMMTFRLTMFYQDVTATPYEMWECRSGEGWICIEQVWEVEVSRLKRVLGKDRSYTVSSDLRRREFQRVIQGMSQRAASTIKRDAENLVRWRANHEPEPCR